METFDKILKHFAFIIVFLVHAILLIALSFVTFKVFKTSIIKEKKANSASIYFKSDKKTNDLIKTVTPNIPIKKAVKKIDKIKSNLPVQRIKPVKKATVQPPKTVKPTIKQNSLALAQKNTDIAKTSSPEKTEPAKNKISEKMDLVKNNIPEKKAEIDENKTSLRDILEPSIKSKELSSNTKKKSTKARMSSKDFLRQACNIYDSNRYEERQRAYRPDSFQTTNSSQNSSQSRHEQVLQERVAYWEDHAYIEMLCDAIVDESNRHKDNYVYYNNYIDDVFPLSFSITADGNLYEIEYLTGLPDVDRHIEAILRKTKFPVNKKCSIYQYKCNFHIRARKGLGQMKIERAHY